MIAEFPCGPIILGLIIIQIPLLLSIIYRSLRQQMSPKTFQWCTDTLPKQNDKSHFSLTPIIFLITPQSYPIHTPIHRIITPVSIILNTLQSYLPNTTLLHPNQTSVQEKLHCSYTPISSHTQVTSQLLQCQIPPQYPNHTHQSYPSLTLIIPQSQLNHPQITLQLYPSHLPRLHPIISQSYTNHTQTYPSYFPNHSLLQQPSSNTSRLQTTRWLSARASITIC